MSELGGFPPVVEKTGPAAAGADYPELVELLRQAERERAAYAYAYHYMQAKLEWFRDHQIPPDPAYLLVRMRETYNEARESGVWSLPHESSPPAG